MLKRALAAGMVAGLLAIGCGRTEFYPQGPRVAGRDAGHGGFDSGAPGPDAGHRPDAGSAGRDAGHCAAVSPLKLEPRKLTHIELLEGSLNHLGASDRLEVVVQLQTTCDAFARVDVAINPGDATDFVSLGAFAWVSQGQGCLPTNLPMATIVTLPGSASGNANVVVTDGHAPPNNVSLSYTRGPCPDSAGCVCYPGLPAGAGDRDADCLTDCDCTPGLSCLGFNGLAQFKCEIPCAGGNECEVRGLVCLNPLPKHAVCAHWDICPGGDYEPCGQGFACGDDHACHDHRELPRSAACDCTDQCPSGSFCILGDTGARTCEIPCASSLDCPLGGMFCTSGAICAFPVK
jgi:hypothetical protein